MQFDFSKDSDKERYRQRYVLGEEVEHRLLAWIKEVLEQDLTKPQREIIISVENNPKTAIVTGNGFGKSYTIACISLAWMYCNPNAFGLVTGGNNAQLKDGLWEDLATLHREKITPKNLPGRVTNSNQDSQLKFENQPNHKLRALSAQNASNLEGKHQGRAFVAIEEANKPDVDSNTIRSAVSTITDEDDRVVIIGNPPKRGHAFDKVLQSDRYKTLHFTAFDSRNVRRELGETDKPSIDGIITPYRIKDIWKDNHPNEQWPGLESAKQMTSDNRSNLGEEWYRLVMGERPPTDATEVKPFYLSDVNDAIDEWRSPTKDITFDAVGVDLSNGGSDWTVAVGITDSYSEVITSVKGATSQQNESVIQKAVEYAEGPVVVDAIGNENFLESLTINPTMFKGSTKAVDEESYYNRRTESYFEVGNWLNNGGTIQPNTDLARELKSIAQVIGVERKSMKTFDNYIATSKEDLKSRIVEGSPDRFDALAMACWGLQAGETGRQIVDHDFSQRGLFN